MSMTHTAQPRSRRPAFVLVLALTAAACSGTSTAHTPPPAPAPTPTSLAVPSPVVLAAASGFVELRTTVAAQAFLDAAEEDGEQRWVPWVLDLLRADISNRVSARSGEVLAALTGVPVDRARVNNMNAFGGWIHDNNAEGGEGYREWKIALYERFDPAFGPLLAQLVDEHDLAALQWGGVVRGGIPELNNQERERGDDADWLEPDEVVFGVSIGDEHVAFPLRILARHELANDVVGGVPVSVVYCTLCRSAILFDRRVNDQVLDFETSGLLLTSNKVMVDVQTDTLWQHLLGTAIGGEQYGTSLTQLPLDTLRWSDWFEAHPDTTVIGRPAPIFFDDPERPPFAYDYTPGEAYRFYYESDDLFFPAGETPGPFGLKEEIIGITHNGDALALGIATLPEATAVEVEVGGATFTVESTGVGARVFDADGNRVVVEQSFWFAWYDNHPETRTRPN